MLRFLLPDEKQCNGTKEEKEKPSAVVRVTQLTNAIRRRTYRAISIQMENLQEKAFDLFLIYPIRLVRGFVISLFYYCLLSLQRQVFSILLQD